MTEALHGLLGSPHYHKRIADAPRVVQESRLHRSRLMAKVITWKRTSICTVLTSEGRSHCAPLRRHWWVCRSMLRGVYRSNDIQARWAKHGTDKHTISSRIACRQTPSTNTRGFPARGDSRSGDYIGVSAFGNHQNAQSKCEENDNDASYQGDLARWWH